MRCHVWLHVNKPAFTEILSFYRPLIFKREADWEREKSLYVASVTRHLKERSSEAPGMNQSETAFYGL